MKKWNRVLALLLAAGMAVCLCGCSAATSRQSEKSLYEHGMEMVDLIRQMADSEEVLALSLGLDADTIDDAMASEPIDTLAHMKQSNLERVYQIGIPLESYWELAESHLNDQGFDADNIPSELREQLWRGACSSMLVNIVYRLAYDTLETGYGYGVGYTMALLNTFQLSNAFASHELEEDTAYLYLFEDVAVMVAFTKMEGGLVTATAAPVFSDEILDASRSGLRRLLEDFSGGEYKFEVEEITPYSQNT